MRRPRGRELIGSAKYYDDATVLRDTRLLGVLDDQVQRGEREGVLETLVAMW